MEEQRNKKGQFIQGSTGNKSGRPKGSRNKLSEVFFDDLYTAWMTHGQNAMDIVARKEPSVFLKVVGTLMPKELAVKAQLAELSDDELTELIAAVRSLTAQLPGGPTDQGAETETRH